MSISIMEKDKVVKLIKQLLEIKTAKGNAKIEYIKNQYLTPLTVPVLKFVYDKQIQTGLSSKTLKKKEPKTEIPSDLDFIKLINYIKKNNTGTNATAELVRGYINEFDNPEVRNMLIQIFSNELKLGVTAKSLNKAFGKDFIREFTVQLAFSYAKYTKRVKDQKFIITQKLDGHRAVCLIKNGHGQFYTRQGLLIPGLEKQTVDLLAFAKNLNQPEFVFDGELLLKNPENLSTKDLFRKTSSILRSKTANKSNITFNIFDGLPLDEFYAGESSHGFAIRKTNLLKTVPESLKNSEIQVLPNLYYGTDLHKIMELQQMLVKPNGWEGLMLNLADGKYATKRTPDILKIKQFMNADVQVTDIFEGSGNLIGTLGGVIIEYKGYPVRVGDGFTKTQRDYYWNHPADIVGHLIDVQYFEETNNQKNNNLSLRFPVFKTVRDDKNQVSFES